MGLLDGMLGNASKVDNASVQDEFAKLLAPGEQVEHAYRLIRDFFAISKTFNKKLSIYEVQAVLASYVMP